MFSDKYHYFTEDENERIRYIEIDNQKKMNVPYHSSNRRKIVKFPSKSCISTHAMEANGQKLTEENMFKKLLHAPSRRKENNLVTQTSQVSQPSQTNHQRKYDPNFLKPDIEDLIKQNILLKKSKHEDKSIIIKLKMKVDQLEKKIVKLQSVNKEKIQDVIDSQNKQKNKNPVIHTEILKKKIYDLQLKYITAEREIKQIKRLPKVSIHEENNIEKQHLVAQTIRLKALLASYQQESQQLHNSDKFQNQFLRMLKEENQKLKATIRLLENQKVLMKSRYTTQNKQNNDLKKQLEVLNQKLLQKEADNQKLRNQNNNLLFKKASQYEFEKQEKENKQIMELQKKIDTLMASNKRLKDDLQFFRQDNFRLKEEKIALEESVSSQNKKLKDYQIFKEDNIRIKDRQIQKKQ